MTDVERNQQLDQTGHHPLYAGFEKNRAFPRVRLRIPVQVGLPGGQVVCARIYNLSPDGLQIRCDPTTAKQIHPSGRTVNDGTGAKLLIALRLRHEGDVRTHILQCKVFYLVPQDRENVIIGLLFEELNTAQRKVIDTVLSASLEPQG